MDRESIAWPAILYGGDYNPDQWPQEVWDEDMELMKRAHVNVATLPVFGWAALEPEEGRYTFEWLDSVLDRMTRAGIRACLATATASVPAWLTQKYPDVLVTDENGVRRKHGNRHSFCPSSANFRRLSSALARCIAQRYRDHPALMLWHVGNEYGTHCYCGQCADAFRQWLQARYGSLEELNRRWYTAFWGHTYSDWSQVEPPFQHGERSIQALRLDYYRFQSESLLACFRGEAEALREETPDVPITTNLMGPFFPLDYHRWAKAMDIVSWDNYPAPDAPPSHVAFNHALMRGLKQGKPFLLMEQSPSQQNWQPHNRLKPPGQLRLQSYQAVAHGADSVMYFQWRRGRGGIEKLHGAVMEHGGSPENRVFQEVAALGAELAALGSRTLGGRTPARAALLFDWENWWALRFSSGPSVDLDYLKVCRSFYAALHSLGVQTDVLSPAADLAPYDLLVAPLLYLIRADDAERITRRVEQGATLVASAFTGLVDETDLVFPDGAPGPLRPVLGISVEETDALPPCARNGIRWLATNEEHETALLCDRIRLEGAETLAVYTDDFYAGEPAVTLHRFGGGQGCYLATYPDSGGLKALFRLLCREKGIRSPLRDGVEPPEGLEVTLRAGPDGRELLYLLNHGSDSAEAPLESGGWRDLLSGETIAGLAALGPRGVRILEKRQG